MAIPGDETSGYVAFHFSCKFMSRLNNGESSCHSWLVALLNDLGGGMQIFELASDLGFSLFVDSPGVLQTTIYFPKSYSKVLVI